MGVKKCSAPDHGAITEADKMKTDATPQHTGIDFATEEILTLHEACKLVKPKDASLATMHRWVTKGIRGVKLETIAVGGRKLTSKEAWFRFVAAQNAPETPVPTITPKQRRKQSEAARVELERMGVR